MNKRAFTGVIVIIITVVAIIFIHSNQKNRIEDKPISKNENGISYEEDSEINNNYVEPIREEEKRNVQDFIGEWKVEGENKGTFKVSEENWQCFKDGNDVYATGRYVITGQYNDIIELYDAEDKFVAKCELKDDILDMNLLEELETAFGTTVKAKK